MRSLMGFLVSKFYAGVGGDDDEGCLSDTFVCIILQHSFYGLT